MARTLTVREVRGELYRAAGGPAAAGDGQASTALLGQWFHDLFATLVGNDPRLSMEAALADAGGGIEEQERLLRRHVYRRLVGPRLPRDHAHLASTTAELLGFWKAIGDLCRWLVELRQEALRGKRRLEIACEEALSGEFHEPGWTDAVTLSGLADAVVRQPHQAPWCVVELKLGRGMPEVDLGQACLYYALLARTRGTAGDGSLALVSFAPRRHVKVFAPAELERALPRLKALIGRLAGVLPDASSAAAKPGPAPSHASPRAVPPPAADHADLGRRLLKVFDEFGAPAVLAGPAIVGPTFLRFPIEPRRGVKVSRIQGTAPEVQSRLRLDAPPFIALERGQLVVDLQRPDRQTVTLAECRAQLPPRDPLAGSSRVPVGVDLENRLHCADLSRPEHAHVLVAGTTGSGKSEWLRAALAGLLLANTPETLRLVLIDPKWNAFNDLAGSPFLRGPEALVYPDERDTNAVLDELVDEMEARYRALQEAGADDLAGLVRATRRPRPRIVCVCDEYADLLGRGRSERKALEDRIVRLGQKARAAGIHLLLATQQPSREAVKGALDSNMPCRVGLKMQKAIESRMLLGTGGAEHLLGQGDLFFRDIGAPRRLQGLYVPPDERARIFGGQR